MYIGLSPPSPCEKNYWASKREMCGLGAIPEICENNFSMHHNHIELTNASCLEISSIVSEIPLHISFAFLYILFVYPFN